MYGRDRSYYATFTTTVYVIAVNPLIIESVNKSCHVSPSLIDLNGKYSAKYRLSIAKKTDERGRIMSEIIVGMRVIKMYAWERPFSLLIERVRKYGSPFKSSNAQVSQLSDFPLLGFSDWKWTSLRNGQY